MKTVLYIVIAFSVLMGTLVALIPSSPGGAQSTSTTPVVQQYVLSYTPDEIVAEYERNTVAADERLKGKAFKVRGQVTSINTDVSGAPYVTMKTSGNNFVEPVFKFKSGQQGVAALSKGQSLELTCIGAGDVLKVPVSRDCTF